MIELQLAELKLRYEMTWKDYNENRPFTIGDELNGFVCSDIRMGRLTGDGIAMSDEDILHVYFDFIPTDKAIIELKVKKK